MVRRALSVAGNCSRLSENLLEFNRTGQAQRRDRRAREKWLDVELVHVTACSDAGTLRDPLDSDRWA